MKSGNLKSERYILVDREHFSITGFFNKTDLSSRKYFPPIFVIVRIPKIRHTQKAMDGINLNNTTKSAEVVTTMLVECKPLCKLRSNEEIFWDLMLQTFRCNILKKFIVRRLCWDKFAC